MDTKRFPDSWYLFKNKHPETNGDNWGEVALKRHPMGGAPTRIPGVTITWTGKEGYANATLVAAAPTLLAALLRVQKALKESGLEEQVGEEEDGYIASAISKILF